MMLHSSGVQVLRKIQVSVRSKRSESGPPALPRQQHPHGASAADRGGHGGRLCKGSKYQNGMHTHIHIYIYMYIIHIYIHTYSIHVTYLYVQGHDFANSTTAQGATM